MGTRAPFTGVKRPGRAVGQLTSNQCLGQENVALRINPCLHTSSERSVWLVKLKDNFNFLQVYNIHVSKYIGHSLAVMSSEVPWLRLRQCQFLSIVCSFFIISSVSAPVHRSIYFQPFHSGPRFSSTFWLTFKQWLSNPCLIHYNQLAPYDTDCVEQFSPSRYILIYVSSVECL
jgi:hypothetical protein